MKDKDTPAKDLEPDEDKKPNKLKEWQTYAIKRFVNQWEIYADGAPKNSLNLGQRIAYNLMEKLKRKFPDSERLLRK